MDRIGVRELNQYTSQVLSRVRNGETIEITDRGRLVARLVPVDNGSAALDQMVSAGRVIPPSSQTPFPLPTEFGDPEVDVAQGLADLRAEERW